MKPTKSSFVVEVKPASRFINLPVSAYSKLGLPNEQLAKSKLKLNFSSDKLKEILEKKTNERKTIVENSPIKVEKPKKKLIKEKSKDPKKSTLNWLCKTYPNLFNKLLRKKPLKVGIAEDIFNDLLTHFPKLTEKGIQEWKKNIKQAIKFYCNGHMYLENIIKVSHRFDLQGNKCMEITTTEKDHAQLLLGLIKDKETKE